MFSPFKLLARLFALCSFAGAIQALIGTFLLVCFCKKIVKKRTSEDKNRTWVPVSILKPLYGHEPLLKEALESFFQLDYPEYELVFGVHHHNDEALTIVRELQKLYPQQQCFIVIDDTEHGANRKISNLINLSRSCHHDVFVISDSDIHVEKDYLKRIIEALETNKTELVTTLYAGLAADKRITRLLGAASINSNFLPGVMMSRFLGRQDCLGATMALKRQTLKKIGGFEALVHHIADDAVLGQMVREHGGDITLAQTICKTTITEENLKELLSHELRWGRTIRSVEPLGYTLSSLQFPLFWASLSVIFNPRAKGGWAIFLLSWVIRAITTRQIAYLTQSPLPAMTPYLIVRDWLSIAVMIGSSRGSRVSWRGRTVHITSRQKSSTPTS